MRKYLGILVLMLGLSLPALAQDVPTEEPPPVVDEQPPADDVATPDQIIDYILNGLQSLTTVAYAVSLVAIVTQLIKVGLVSLLPRLGLTISIDPALLALVVQIIFWLGHVISTQTGYGQQYKDAIAMIEAVLRALQPVLPVALASAVTVHAVYNVAHKSSVPGFRTRAKRAATPVKAGDVSQDFAYPQG